MKTFHDFLADRRHDPFLVECARRCVALGVEPIALAESVLQEQMPEVYVENWFQNAWGGIKSFFNDITGYDPTKHGSVNADFNRALQQLTAIKTKLDAVPQAQNRGVVKKFYDGLGKALETMQTMSKNVTQIQQMKNIWGDEQKWALMGRDKPEVPPVPQQQPPSVPVANVPAVAAQVATGNPVSPGTGDDSATKPTAPVPGMGSDYPRQDGLSATQRFQRQYTGDSVVTFGNFLNERGSQWRLKRLAEAIARTGIPAELLISSYFERHHPELYSRLLSENFLKYAGRGISDFWSGLTGYTGNNVPVKSNFDSAYKILQDLQREISPLSYSGRKDATDWIANLDSVVKTLQPMASSTEKIDQFYTAYKDNPQAMGHDEPLPDDGSLAADQGYDDVEFLPDDRATSPSGNKSASDVYRNMGQPVEPPDWVKAKRAAAVPPIPQEIDKTPPHSLPIPGEADDEIANAFKNDPDLAKNLTPDPAAPPEPDPVDPTTLPKAIEIPPEPDDPAYDKYVDDRAYFLAQKARARGEVVDDVKMKDQARRDVEAQRQGTPMPESFLQWVRRYERMLMERNRPRSASRK